MSDTTRRRRPRREQADPAALTRLFEIPRESAEHLILANGPVTPDAALLDQAAEALYLMARAEAIETECEELLNQPRPKPSAASRAIAVFGGIDPWEAQLRARRELLYEESQALIKKVRPIMRTLAKTPAKTAAGIYAKALIVRGSRTGAAVLARSLARDLTALPALRASLWSDAPQ